MIIEVVGAVIRDARGRVLTVRKRGAKRYMLPGGKREPLEDDQAALGRELEEELGVRLLSATLLGAFEAEAANEPGARLKSTAYLTEIDGDPVASGEIEAITWIDPGASDIPLAPMLEFRILPALSALSAATREGSR